VKLRRGQDYFRQAVINNCGGRCALTGLAIRELLIASHILPWGSHPEQRLDVRNGLSLTRLHDAAFDRGLIAFRVTEVKTSNPFRGVGTRSKGDTIMGELGIFDYALIQEGDETHVHWRSKADYVSGSEQDDWHPCPSVNPWFPFPLLG
jgi:hypothetical protein